MSQLSEWLLSVIPFNSQQWRLFGSKQGRIQCSAGFFMLSSCSSFIPPLEGFIGEKIVCLHFLQHYILQNSS